MIHDASDASAFVFLCLSFLDYMMLMGFTWESSEQIRPTNDDLDINSRLQAPSLLTRKLGSDTWNLPFQTLKWEGNTLGENLFSDN